MTMLSIKNLSSGYGKAHAINDINIDVRKKEIVTLIGANGAGKSTLLRTISGTLKPAKGNITFNGKNIGGKKQHDIVKIGITHIPEGRGILAQMSVLENLEMGAYLRNDKKNISADLDNVFEKFPRLKERIAQIAGSLSGGEQQMLAIGRALMSRPTLLLMDEPSLGLAPIIVDMIIDTIKKLSVEDGYTILLVEQNANQALAVSDRGYVIETGRIVLEGESSVLRDNTDVQRAYLGKA